MFFSLGPRPRVRLRGGAVEICAGGLMWENAVCMCMYIYIYIYIYYLLHVICCSIIALYYITVYYIILCYVVGIFTKSPTSRGKVGSKTPGGVFTGVPRGVHRCLLSSTGFNWCSPVFTDFSFRPRICRPRSLGSYSLPLLPPLLMLPLPPMPSASATVSLYVYMFIYIYISLYTYIYIYIYCCYQHEVTRPLAG